MAVLFTSDSHFGHRNVIKYANRPFATVEEMDAEMIRRWNSKVHHGDTVYHTGDFTFKDPWPYLRQLNGKIILVPGNHDNMNRWAHSQMPNVSVAPQLLEVHCSGQMIVLCHYAMRTWNASHYGSWHLYGHSHGSLADDPNSRSCDIGVDCWDFYPVTMQQLADTMAKKTFTPIDHHKEKAE